MIESLVNLDISITEFFVNMTHSPIVDKIMVFFTSLGDAGFIWILCGIVFLIFKKTRTMGAALLLSLAFSFLISQLVIKELIDRSRPHMVVEGVNLLISVPRGSSFPSSHTATAFASAMSIFCFSKKYSIIALALAALIGFTRIYLCVHFLSDVIVGAIFGAAMGFFITRLLFFKKESEDEPA